MSIETVCCESMSITCFAFVSKCEMWFEKCDSDLFFAKIVWNNSFSWSCLIISSSIFFRSFNFIFWRMTHVHSRLSNDVCLFSICRATSMMRRQIWWSISSNLKWDDSSNLTKATYQTWRKRFIRFDEKNVISSNLTKASFHQIWRKRHLIKLDESVISSNFEKEEQFFYFLISDLMLSHMIWRT
jgi:hypothetical protein